MTDPVDPHQNQLLASLPAQEWLRWQPQLERVEMPLGNVLHKSGVPLRYVYFPINAIVSLLYVLENGSSAETAVVGREGVVGISIFMGGGSSSTRAVVQSAGIGYRMRADGIKAEFERSIPVMHLMLRFTQALITQMSQTAVCNRHHSVDQQLCRWLLISLDRLAGDELVMTHHLISDMLGVRREGVTAAARQMRPARDRRSKSLAPSRLKRETYQTVWYVCARKKQVQAGHFMLTYQKSGWLLVTIGVIHCGIGFILGWLMQRWLQRFRALPHALGWVLLATGVLVAYVLPVSGAWLFIPLGLRIAFPPLRVLNPA